MVDTSSPLRRPVLFGLVMILPALGSGMVRAAEDHDSVTKSAPLLPAHLIEAVLARNPQVKAMEAAAQAAEARVVSAGSLPDPELSGAVAPATIGGYDSPDGRGTNVRVEISQALPWPGTRGLRADAARKEAAAVTESVAALRLRLIAATMSAYAEWHYVHQALAVNADNQALVAELRRVAEKRYAAGLARQQDVLQAEVELQRLGHQAIQLKRLKRAMRAKINHLLNRPAAETLAAPAELPRPRGIPPYRQLRDRALVFHPELAQIQRRIAANEDREALARKDFYPDVKVFGGYNSLWDAEDKRWIMGAGINLPLSRDKYRARLDEAKADTLRLKHELADRRSQLLSQLEQAHAAAQEAEHSITLYESELIPLARENLSAARAEYGAGDGSFLDVIDAQQSKLDAELNLERVRADYFAALAELRRWTGGELPDTAMPAAMNTTEPSYD